MCWSRGWDGVGPRSPGYAGDQAGCHRRVHTTPQPPTCACCVPRVGLGGTGWRQGAQLSQPGDPAQGPSMWCVLASLQGEGCETCLMRLRLAPVPVSLPVLTRALPRAFYCRLRWADRTMSLGWNVGVAKGSPAGTETARWLGGVWECSPAPAGDTDPHPPHSSTAGGCGHVRP